MRNIQVQRLFQMMSKISRNIRDEGMIGSNLTTRNLEALPDKDYNRMIRKPPRLLTK